MLKTNKPILIIFSFFLLLSLQGCGSIVDFFEEMFDPNLMIIRGEKTYSGENEVLEITPGTRVVFRESGKFLFSEGYANRGQLIFSNGAKLIATGEAERIIFEPGDNVARGYITLEENASNDSIIKYCELIDLNLNIKNLTTINHNKFQQSLIDCYFSGSTVIEYNSFEGDPETYGTGIVSGYLSYDPPVPTVSAIIKYNIINNWRFGICFNQNDTPVIEYNNFTNCGSYAVGWISGTINNNYISDCNGKTGVDTTGEQSGGVSYQNPQTSPIAEAGCGW